MKTSVAMCTYNGASFIKEQLDSILNQSLFIDEIIICDDGSTDGTISIINKFVELFPYRIFLYQNEKSLGVSANFNKAIDLCSNELIFLADQDDVWLRDKARIILDYFIKNKDKSVVISNASLIDEHNNKISNLTLFDVLGLTEHLKYFDKGLAMEIFLRRNRATGCTMALRKKFKPYIQINSANDSKYHQIHDACIAMSAILMNTLGYITTPLTLYRQHATQQIGLRGLIEHPWHFSTPYLPLNYIDTTYGISHPRIEMQVDRVNYIKKSSIILHLKKYYEAYSYKLMWSFVFYDLYKKCRWITKCGIRKLKQFCK